jgi:hypothetical protein
LGAWSTGEKGRRRGETRGRRGRAAARPWWEGEGAVLEVEGGADRWAPPVGDRVREGERRGRERGGGAGRLG